MAELYKNAQDYKKITEEYERLGKEYGWLMEIMDSHLIMLTKSCPYEITLKTLEKYGYTQDKDNSNNDILLFNNKLLGKGITLSLDLENIALTLAANEGAINKKLEAILKETDIMLEQSNV